MLIWLVCMRNREGINIGVHLPRGKVIHWEEFLMSNMEWQLVRLEFLSREFNTNLILKKKNVPNLSLVLNILILMKF